MANTVDLNNIEEFSDSPAELDAKLDSLAALLRDAQRLVFFTGAGISVSSGIPDYRGPTGVWTSLARGEAPPSGTPMIQAVPTKAHMALVALQQAGRLDYLVSQNVDGLHRRSGIERERISELHGNMYNELCWGCGQDVQRGFDVAARINGDGVCPDCKQRVPHFCHCTGRDCQACGAPLKDSIIHFGENLPVEALSRGMEHSGAADVCVVLGSSCTVSPACDLPRSCARNGGKLVIVNLQRTPLDSDCSLRLFARTDEVMEGLMRRLEIPIPAFKVRKTLTLGAADGEVSGTGDADDGDVSDVVADVLFQPGDVRVEAPPFACPGAESAEVRFLPGTNQAPVTLTAAAPSVAVECDAATSRPHVPLAAQAVASRRAAAAAASASAGADDASGAISGAVQPRSSCAHVAVGLPAEGALMPAGARCSAGDCAASELWLCVECGDLSCGRFANAHAVAHREATGHRVAASLADLSFYCSACDDYVLETLPALWPVYARLHQEKFGEAPPGGPLEEPAPPVAPAPPAPPADLQQEDGSFFVAVFRHDCPHYDECVNRDIVQAHPGHFSAPCADCGDTTENWICLCCGKIACSRYINGHMLAHSDDRHGMALSLRDLSPWCFRCDSYVTSPALVELRMWFEMAKRSAEGGVPVLSLQ